MKALCIKEDLSRILDIAGRISARNHALPILQTVRIEVSQNTADIRATNLELGLIGTMSVKDSEDGVCAVPAHTLLQVISHISTPTLTIETEGDICVVSAQKSRFEIKTLAHDDFPTITHTNDSVGIDGTQFSIGIKHVVFAASQSSIKPELGAVYVHQKKSHSLSFVATDSFRLAEYTVQTPQLTLAHSLLIPQRNALEIARTIEILGESPKIHITESALSCTFSKGIYITSRLITGSFPDYEQIIPKEYQTYATLLSKDLERALRAVSIFSNKFMQVVCEISPEEGNLTLRSEHAEYGRAKEVVKIDGHGTSLTLSFNQQYLLESLSHFPSDSIELSFAGIGRPLVIKPHASDTFRYLVMPMNK
jgi:DNA polymerase III subunit beta